MTKEDTYNIATGLFVSGASTFAVDASPFNKIYAVVIAAGTDNASQVQFKQGNTTARLESESVAITGSPLAITGDGVFDITITDFEGDFGIIKPANLTATVGTLKIQVKT